MHGDLIDGEKMAEPVAEKIKCENCGASVRPDTHFCYACGLPVINSEPPAIPQPSGDDVKELEAALAASQVDEAAKSKTETASGERRKARISQRKPREVVWEPAGPGLVYFIAAAAIFLFVLLIVFLTRSARY